MRPGQKNRSRGRNGGGMPHHNRGGGGGGGGPRPPHRSQSFESNGPSVKIRGNAYQVFERYIAMAREAQTSGDRVAAENLYQHAEHYFSIITVAAEAEDPPRRIAPRALRATARASRYAATRIRCSSAISRWRGRRRRAATGSRRKTSTSTPSIISAS